MNPFSIFNSVTIYILWVLVITYIITAICKNMAMTKYYTKFTDEGGGGGDGGTDYNIDPDDPQDYWKKDGGKAFK
jgi:hypothetical protein